MARGSRFDVPAGALLRERWVVGPSLVLPFQAAAKEKFCLLNRFPLPFRASGLCLPVDFP